MPVLVALEKARQYRAEQASGFALEFRWQGHYTRYRYSDPTHHDADNMEV
jgi:hypothetical protein